MKSPFYTHYFKDKTFYPISKNHDFLLNGRIKFRSNINLHLIKIFIEWGNYDMLEISNNYKLSFDDFITQPLQETGSIHKLKVFVHNNTIIDRAIELIAK